MLIISVTYAIASFIFVYSKADHRPALGLLFTCLLQEGERGSRAIVDLKKNYTFIYHTMYHSALAVQRHRQCHNLYIALLQTAASAL